MGDRFAEHLTEVVYKPERDLIPCLRSIKNILAGDLGKTAQCGFFFALRKESPGHADNACRRCILLKASFLAAAADIRLIIAHLHMSDLTGCPAASRENLSADNDTAADTCAEGDAYCIVRTLCCACHELAVCCCVCVVLNEAGLVDECLHKLYNVEILEA